MDSNNNINSSTSELFVCFTSRLSSSSMKLSSKSILSPSRGRDPQPPQISLSSSLSRRLKSNSSMKGGQASPMFPTAGGGKRRGCGFENPEPSSPKVTCIGQVRVKTKKQGKKMRAGSKRRVEASFRKAREEVGGSNNNINNNPDLVLTRQNSSQSFGFQSHSQSLQQECLKQRNNQRWVHLPLTICEALREFSCFFPCRSSCTSGEREREEKGSTVVVRGVEGGGGGGSGGGDGGREGSCGAAFARWLQVALQEGDGKGRGIELVMQPEEEEDGEEEDGREESERSRSSRSQRRHVFEDIDIDLVEEGKKKHEEEFGEEEKGGRVSICIPPKNALLLMRCRSDPVKMAALANRFWDSPLKKHQDQEEEEEEDSEEEEEQEGHGGEQDQHIEMEEDEDEDEEQEQKQVQLEIKTEELQDSSISVEEGIVIPSLQDQEEEADEAKPDVKKESFDIESRLNPEERNEIPEVAKEEQDQSKDGEEDGNHHQGENFSCLSLPEADADLDKPETEETHLRFGEEEKENHESSELSEPESVKAEAEADGSTEREHAGSDPVKDPDESKEQEIGSKEKETLPECLLLMMCEPKLSMEVSKETWVCSTDFIRRLPGKPTAVKVVDGGGGKRVSLDSSSSKVKPKPKPPQPLMQPPRSSCSFPAGGGGGGGGGISMAAMIEQKLVGSHNGYEPFVLTRCKSEPLRSSAKLMPEPCFWNNRKLEPTAPLGVGAQAGVGF